MVGSKADDCHLKMNGFNLIFTLHLLVFFIDDNGDDCAVNIDDYYDYPGQIKCASANIWPNDIKLIIQIIIIIVPNKNVK